MTVCLLDGIVYPSGRVLIPSKRMLILLGSKGFSGGTVCLPGETESPLYSSVSTLVRAGSSVGVGGIMKRREA